jgi:hypothetical protein
VLQSFMHSTRRSRIHDLQSRTKAMARPVRPPMLFNAFVALEAAPETMDPPELVTRDRPSDAFDTAPEAVSFALEAVSPAASLAFVAVSAVVEACLTFCRRRRYRDWRSNARVAGGADIAAGAQRRPVRELRGVRKTVTSASRLSGSIGDGR